MLIKQIPLQLQPTNTQARSQTQIARDKHFFKANLKLTFSKIVAQQWKTYPGDLLLSTTNLVIYMPCELVARK